MCRMILLEELRTRSLFTFKDVSLPHATVTGKADFADSATRIAPVIK